MDLTKIRRAVSDHFDSVVTDDKLKNPCGSKTVRHAKAVGVYIARIDGHGNDDIAATFGYSSGKSVSNLFSKVGREIGYYATLDRDIGTIAGKLGIDLE